jgi:hypothetical protein
MNALCNESGIVAKPFQPLGSDVSFPPYILSSLTLVKLLKKKLYIVIIIYIVSISTD